MNKLLIAIVLISFLALPVQAAPAVYYVAPGGLDSNPGTLAQPWKTIQKAVDAMQGGDTVYLRGGTYNQTVRFVYKPNTTRLFMTLASYPGELAIIDGTGIAASYSQEGLVYLKRTAYVRISGLRIQNSNGAGIYAGYGDHYEFINNQTYDTVKSGIGVWYASEVLIDGNDVELACHAHAGYPASEEPVTINGGSAVEIQNNVVHDGDPNILYGGAGGEGINVKYNSAHIKIHDNEVYNLWKKVGISVDAWGGTVDDVQIYDNRTHDNLVGITVSNEGTTGLASNIRVYNNTVTNNTLYGLYLPSYMGQGPIANVEFSGNTVTGNAGYGVYLASGNARNIVVKNNVITGNGAPIFNASGATLENNQTAQPTATPRPTATPTATPTPECIAVTFSDGTRVTVCK